MSALLPSPLRWDEERTWNFAVDIEDPVLYLIRDHINMLTDLGKDWSAGPPSDFDTFVPMNYGISLTMTNYEFNLYANDHNIIDRPLDKRDNGKSHTLSLVKYRSRIDCIYSFVHAEIRFFWKFGVHTCKYFQAIFDGIHFLSHNRQRRTCAYASPMEHPRLDGLFCEATS